MKITLSDFAAVVVGLVLSRFIPDSLSGPMIAIAIGLLVAWALLAVNNGDSK
jgi:uncharacterized membrane protein YccC